MLENLSTLVALESLNLKGNQISAIEDIGELRDVRINIHSKVIEVSLQLSWYMRAAGRTQVSASEGRGRRRCQSR